MLAQDGLWVPEGMNLTEASLWLLPGAADKMTDRKAVIKNADMSEDMQQDAVDCATQAMEKYNIEKDIAAYIKKVRLSLPAQRLMDLILGPLVVVRGDGREMGLDLSPSCCGFGVSEFLF